MGLPHVSSDRGAQFTSKLWTAVGKLLGTQHYHTTSYQPQANGLVEHFHRHLKSALRASLHEPNRLDELPWVLLSIHTEPKGRLGDFLCRTCLWVTIPGDLVLFSPSTVPNALTFLPVLREKVQDLTPDPGPGTRSRVWYQFLPHNMAFPPFQFRQIL